VRKLHWFENAVDDQRRAQARAQTKKQHSFAPVASERLHRRVVDHLHRTAAKRLLEIENRPIRARRFVRFTTGGGHGRRARNSRPTLYRTSSRPWRLAPRRPSSPASSWAGRDDHPFGVAGGQHLHVRAADVDHQDSPAIGCVGRYRVTVSPLVLHNLVSSVGSGQLCPWASRPCASSGPQVPAA